jgi:hypothetical protein
MVSASKSHWRLRLASGLATINRQIPAQAPVAPQGRTPLQGIEPAPAGAGQAGTARWSRTVRFDADSGLGLWLVMRITDNVKAATSAQSVRRMRHRHTDVR